MHSAVMKDLSKTKGADIFKLLADFNKNAQWAGYFFGGMDEVMLRQMQNHPTLPRHGFHVTVWHKANNTLNVYDFMRLVTTTERENFKVTGYADNGQNQAVSVTRPSLYMSPAQPHVSISWEEKANPAASGYLTFGKTPDNCPTDLHKGRIKIIMHNNREMVLDVYRNELIKLMMKRSEEIGKKLDPAVKGVLDKIYLEKALGEKPLDEMTMSEIKSKFVLTGLEFNENVAMLYAQYVTSAVELYTKTRSDVEKEEDLEDAKHDKETDLQHEENDAQ